MRRRRHGALKTIALAVAMLISQGCAELADRKSEEGRAVTPASRPEGESRPRPAEPPQVSPAPAPPAAQPSKPLPKVPSVEAGAPGPPPAVSPEAGGLEEELYDPFAKPGERAEEVEEYDPWEPFNVAMFNLNRKIDRYVLKPVATAYDKVMPDELERGLSRFFHNVRFVPRFLNNIFQGKFKGAGIELTRFVVNTAFGIAGTLDFAKEVFGLETPDEDTGQTLGFYGVKPGPYLVLPLLPPFTLRDALGYVADIMLDPINYFAFATIRVGQPAWVTDQDAAFFANFGARTEEIVNERSINLETFQGVEEATVDLYGAVRNAYLQKRAQAVRQ